MSNENDEKPRDWPGILRGIADIIKAIGGSSQSLTTIAIAIGFSVTLSTVTIMYVPQVQYALLGPPGPQGMEGPQGVPGEPGSDAELTTLEAQLTNYIFDLEDELSDLGAQDVALSTQHSADLAILQSQIADLELKVAALEAVPIGPSGLGELIHDSGWIAIDQGKGRMICKLPSDLNVFVYMIGREENSWPIHQIHYGGDVLYDRMEIYSPRGASWSVSNDNFLMVNRYRDDLTWEEVRVIVWQLPS